MTSHHGSDWPREIHLSVWYCELEHPTTLFFSNVIKFRAHMSDAHAESHDRIDLYVRRRRTQGERMSGYCPLCEVTPVSTHGSPLKTRDEHLGHIAGHLKSLALLSLPQPTAECSGSTEPESIDPPTTMGSSIKGKLPIDRVERDDLEPIQKGDQDCSVRLVDDIDPSLPLLMRRLIQLYATNETRKCHAGRL